MAHAGRATASIDRSRTPSFGRALVATFSGGQGAPPDLPAEGSRIVRTILSNNKVFSVSARHLSAPASRAFGAPLLHARAAPMADAASSSSAAPAAPLRCRNETPAAPRARAAGAASASLASRAGSHVPSSHDCCRSRCASVDVLAGIACAPAGWSCAGTFASSALSATGASGLFRSLLLQSRCLEAAIFATGLRLRLRRLSARRLPSLGPDPAALAHPVEVPRGYAVACVCGYFWVPVLLWVPVYFLGASGPQTSFRMAPPRERGAGDASSEHC